MLMRTHQPRSRRFAVLLACLLAQGLAGGAAADDAAATADAVGEERDRLPSVASREENAQGEAPGWRESTLSGDWDGARQTLFDAGVQLDLVYSADYLRNTTGGLQRGGAYMGNVNLAVQFDGEKLIGWEGGSAYLELISNSGGRLNLNQVGSFMGVDNLEAPVNRTGLFAAWLQQSFLDDQASLLLGLYPIDSEFYVTDSSGVFVHPSFGMAAEAADFGSLAGPSIYATSTYGARLRVDPDPAWYALLAITRGIASERIDSAGPNLSWQRGNGSMLIGEIGFSPARAGGFDEEPGPAEYSDDDFAPLSKLALGVWRFSPRFAQLAAVDAAGEPLAATHWGAYLLAEQTVYRLPEAKRDLTLFVRYGFTDGRTSTLGYSLSTGLSVRGPFAGREDDTFGLAATRAHADPQGRAQLANEAGRSLSAPDETVVELTYQAALAPGVVVQPVVQRVFNPGFYLPHATVAGVRLQLTL